MWYLVFSRRLCDGVVVPRPPSPPSRKQFGLRLDVAVMRKIQHLAVDEDVNVNDLVEEALADLLKKRKRRG